MKKYWPIAKMNLVSLAALLLIVPSLSTGQTFTSISSYIYDVGRSAVAWADYDNDQDLDLLISGLGANDIRITRIYRNDEGELTAVENGLLGYKETSVSWGDMDDDGDLDLLISGNTENGDRTRIYRNDDGDLVETDPGMVNVQLGDVCWMDYDADGDLDAFVTGNWMAKVYRNDNGAFVDIGQDFGYFSSSAADWGDFDNDGDLDLLILGDSGAGAVTKIFRNDEGTFNSLDAGLNGLMAGCADWVDYDNDGDLDLSIAGNDDALEAQCFLYYNDGEGQFALVEQLFEGFALGDADWGDYDNDGDLDMIYSGKCTGCGVNVSGIYRNEGNDEFSHLVEVFPALMRSAIQWADFDNDGDLDFIVTGTTLSGTPQTYMYRNNDGSNSFQYNTAPTQPTALSVSAEDRKVCLSWEKSTDLETVQDALSYNIRVGVSSDGNEVVPAMAHTATGLRKVTDIGNAGLSNAFCLENLAPGIYYWSVQAVDQGFSGSAFAPEQTFEVVATAVSDQVTMEQELLTFYPNPARDLVYFKEGMLNRATRITVSDLAGKCHLDLPVSAEPFVLDISSLGRGVYLVRALGTDTISTNKLIIK